CVARAAPGGTRPLRDDQPRRRPAARTARAFGRLRGDRLCWDGLGGSRACAPLDGVDGERGDAAGEQGGRWPCEGAAPRGGAHLSDPVQEQFLRLFAPGTPRIGTRRRNMTLQMEDESTIQKNIA